MAYFWSRGSNKFLQENMRGSSSVPKENGNGWVLLYLSKIIFYCHYKWQTGSSIGTFSPFPIWLLHQFIAIIFLNANFAKIMYRNKIIFYQVAYYQKTCTLPPPPTTSISFASKNSLSGTLHFLRKKSISQNTALGNLTQLKFLESATIIPGYQKTLPSGKWSIK